MKCIYIYSALRIISYIVKRNLNGTRARPRQAALSCEHTERIRPTFAHTSIDKNRFPHNNSNEIGGDCAVVNDGRHFPSLIMALRLAHIFA